MWTFHSDYCSCTMPDRTCCCTCCLCQVCCCCIYCSSSSCYSFSYSSFIFSPFVVALKIGDRRELNFGETLNKGVLGKSTFMPSISVVKIWKNRVICSSWIKVVSVVLVGMTHFELKFVGTAEMAWNWDRNLFEGYSVPNFAKFGTFRSEWNGIDNIAFLNHCQSGHFVIVC